ncbi:MAG TPA: HAD family phosphatase [Dehalococcoidia bacterium]|nr:HAD family phosphatase [Dehalococcoidia bacterium]
MPPDLDALLWDLDGVIVDSTAYHAEAYRRILHEFGQQLDEEYFRRELFGRRNEDILSHLLPQLPPRELPALARRKEEVYRSLLREGHLQPLPGARELVQRLAEAGVRQAIVSSTPPENIAIALDSLGLAGRFRAIVSGEDVARGKPDPQGYVLGAQRLGVSPARCVVIEDAPPGIEAARAAGMRCIGVATTRAPEALTTADLVVATLEDLRVRQFLGLAEG